MVGDDADTGCGALLGGLAVRAGQPVCQLLSAHHLFAPGPDHVPACHLPRRGGTPASQAAQTGLEPRLRLALDTVTHHHDQDIRRP